MATCSSQCTESETGGALGINEGEKDDRDSSSANWQTTKGTVRERTAFLFNNSLMSDITFVLTDPDGTQVRVPAHKLVLAISSPVFEVMFYGELAEKTREIELPDIDAVSFLEFLRFVYCDEVQLTADNALRVLNVAKKYIVPTLEARCRQFLEDNIDETNACQILEEARQFAETDAEKQCWDLIDGDTSACLESDQVLHLSHVTLVSLLGRDNLSTKEIELFDAAKRWAEAQCDENDVYPTGEEMRRVLAEAVNLIRFPTIRPQDFARRVVPTGILTDKEVSDMHQYYYGVIPESGIKFVSTSRKGIFSSADLHECPWPLRAPKKSKTPRGSSVPEIVTIEESLALTVEPRDVYLKGVHIATHEAGIFVDDEKTYNAELHLFDQTERELAVATGKFKSRRSYNLQMGRIHTIVVTLEEPILIHKASKYTIRIKIDGKGLASFDPPPSGLVKAKDLYFDLGLSRLICKVLFYIPD